MDLDFGTAARAFGDRYFNLIRRGADGSLALSADRWRLVPGAGEQVRFDPQAAEAEPLTLPMEDVTRITWDRLPKQQVRSQIRFFLRNGDLWTFSGSVDETALGN